MTKRRWMALGVAALLALPATAAAQVNLGPDPDPPLPSPRDLPADPEGRITCYQHLGDLVICSDRIPPPGARIVPNPANRNVEPATSTAEEPGGCLAVDGSVCSGDSTALDDSTSSGCSTAVDDSTASGGLCTAPERPAPPEALDPPPEPIAPRVTPPEPLSQPERISPPVTSAPRPLALAG